VTTTRLTSHASNTTFPVPSLNQATISGSTYAFTILLYDTEKQSTQVIGSTTTISIGKFAGYQSS